MTKFVRRSIYLWLLVTSIASFAVAAERERGLDPDRGRGEIRMPGRSGGDRGSDQPSGDPWTTDPNSHGYELRVNPAPIYMPSPGRQLITLTITSFNGFSGVVTVNHSETHPSILVLHKDCPPEGGPSCPIQDIPFTVPAGGSVSEQLLVSTTSGSPGGDILFKTSTPTLPDKNPANLTSVIIGAQPQGFNIAPDPFNPTITRGQSRQIAVNLTRLGGYTGEVTVAVTAPSGFTFNEPVPLVFAPGQTTKPLTINVDSSVPVAEEHSINLFATSPLPFTSQSINLLVNVVAPAPDFTLSAVPSSINTTPGGTGEFRVTVNPINGFSEPVTLSFPNHPNLTFTEGGGVISPGSSSLFKFQVANSATAPSSIDFVVFGNASGGLRREAHVLIGIQAPVTPDFTFAVAPNPVSVTQNASAPATITITRTGGFTGDVNVSGTTTATGVTINSVNIPAGQNTGTLNIVAAGNAQTGPATINFTANAPSISKTQTAVVNLTVVAQQAPADFTISSAPSEVQVTAGGTSRVTLTLNRQNFTGNVTVNTTPATGMRLTPSSFTFTGATTTQDFDIEVDANAPAGRAPVTFTATSSGLPGVSRTATTGVTVIPVSSGAPILTSITPEALSAGAQRAVVILAGRNFVNGAQVLSDRADVIVQSVEIQSGTIARVVVNVDPFAEAGPTTFRLRNPDGETTAQGVDLLVYEDGDIGAPLGVTAAAILSPLGGKIVTNADRPYATGVVATTGTGTITGRWLFDGGTFDTFTITVSAGEPAMVTSRVPIPSSHAGPHQLQLVIDSPQQAQSAGVAIRMALDSASNLTVLAPVAEAPESGSRKTTLRWSMLPGAQGYVVELTRDGQPFASQIDVGQEAEVTLDSADLPTEGGPIRWRVAPLYCCTGNDPYAGTFSDWNELRFESSARENRDLFESIRDTAITEAITPRLRYQLASLGTSDQGGASNLVASTSTYAQASQPAGGGAAQPREGLRTDFSIVPMLTTTLTRDAEEQDASFQLSGQGDLGLAPFSTKYTTDYTGANILGDEFTFKGSRNWVINVGNAKRSKRAIRPEVIFGYGPPDFFRGAQLVTSSLARGGALGRVATRFGSLAYYSTFTDVLDGVVAGNFGMQQKVDAVALELRETKKLSFKIITMRVEDLPLSSQSAPRGEGRSLGFLTTYKVSPRLQLVAEAARGRGEWTTRNGLREREGDAVRVGVSGMVGKSSYRADLNHTDSDYSNPGNRSFTTAAIPNRTGGSLSITRPVGRGSATFGLKHQTQTRSSISARATGFNLSYNIALLPTVSLSATANTNTDSADPDTARRMPRTDRQQLGATITLSERFGRFNLSQSLAHQRLDDDVNRRATNNVTTFTVSGGGTIVQNFDLFASSTFIRTEAAPTVGDGDNITFSLQPTFAIPRLYLSLQPRLSYNVTKNEFTRNTNRSEQYAALVQWSPSWFQSAGSLQLSTNWNRNEAEFPGVTTSSTDRSYVGTFTLKWGEGIGADMFRRNRLPGELPVTGRSGASQDPVNGKTPASGK